MYNTRTELTGLTRKQEMVYVSAVAKVSARAGTVNGATADQLACLGVPEVLTAEGQHGREG